MRRDAIVGWGTVLVHILKVSCNLIFIGAENAQSQHTATHYKSSWRTFSKSAVISFLLVL